MLYGYREPRMFVSWDYGRAGLRQVHVAKDHWGNDRVQSLIETRGVPIGLAYDVAVIDRAP